VQGALDNARRCCGVSALAPRHEREPLEQVHVLLILDQRAVQRLDQLLRVARPRKVTTHPLLYP